jgi:hypothetical protein
MMKMTRARYECLAGWVLCLLLAVPAHAYDSSVPMSKVPPHGQPWVETTRLDLQTLFLWKFSVGDDPRVETEVDDKDDPMERGTAEPELHGGAAVTAKAGRFGGGLTLSGTGYAEGAAPLSDLLKNEGGFTVDAWCRADTPKAPEALLCLPDAAGKPLLTLTIVPDAAVVLAIDGTERLRVPLAPTVGNWHHFALVLSGGLERTSVELLVDGATQRAATPAWVKGVGRRLGETLTFGGGAALPGLHGVLDEVRLSAGTRYVYPWNLGRQELAPGRQEAPLQAPFFKSGKVLTRFHFDGTLTPESFAGRAVEGKSVATLYKDGLKGQALDLTQIAKAGFTMSGLAILPEKDGTVEFWFRPLEWDNFYVGDYQGTDVKSQRLMGLAAKDTPAWGATKEIEVSKGRNWEVAHQRAPDGSSAMAWTAMHPGTWTHVLITVSGSVQTVYLNGQRTKFWQGGLVVRKHPPAQDDGTWLLTFTPSATLVDEFSVFSWGMSAEEAWNAYARWLPDAAAQMRALPNFRVEFDYAAHAWDGQEKLVTRLACLPVNDVKPVSVDLIFRAENGDILLSVEKQPLDDTGSTTCTLKRPLPFGRYAATVRSRDAAGAVLREEHRDYVREKPAWFGNTLGKDRTVPKPWTPVAVAGSQLQVIGRTLSLGTNGLPAALEARRQRVLAAPMTMRAHSAAGAGVLDGKGVTFTETAPDRAAWQATLTGAGLSAAVDAWMEFDGLLYCAVTLKPAAGDAVQVETLDIDVPLNPAVATQLLANGGGNDFRTSWIARLVPEGQGSVWRSVDKPYPAFTRALGVTNFMPHIWLGNDDAGLYFGAENDQGWTVDGPKPAQEIVRQADAVHFQMHIIREPSTITKEGRRFHFVLLPTPAKPEPPDWRAQMATGGVNFAAVDSFSEFDLKTDPADPGKTDNFLLEPRSWANAIARAPLLRAKSGRCILYADASWPGLGPAFRDWRQDMWGATGRLAWTPACEDYAVWAINEYLARGLIDGVYWDDVSCGSTLLLDSTAYPYADGPHGRRVGFTTLAQRRVNMRLWRLFEAAGKEPCIWAHMTVCYEVPLFSFCRYLANGEFVTGVAYPKARDAMDFWSPETLRLLGSAGKWGAGVNFLTTLPRQLPVSAAADQWAYPQRRTETGLYLTSDIMAIADGLGEKLRKEGFFAAPLTAWPWWKSAEVVAVDAPKGAQIYTAVYAGTDKAYVIVANRDREARDIALRLQPGALFPGAAGVVWRDIDPGLTPPKKVMATEEEVENLDPDGIDGTRDAGPTLAEQMKALALRTEGTTARVVIRARDYRVLEVRPTR